MFVALAWSVVNNIAFNQQQSLEKTSDLCGLA
jgi:hypothetical protein